MNYKNYITKNNRDASFAPMIFPRRKIFLRSISICISFVFLFQQLGITQSSKYNDSELFGGSIQSSSLEKSQQGKYEPSYLKRLQNRREELLNQKMAKSNLINENLMKRKFDKPDEDLPLKKKQGTGGSDGTYYTIEDFGMNGEPMQLTAYIYEGGFSSGKLLEMVTYDISDANAAYWKNNATENENDDGDKYWSSSNQIKDWSSLTEDKVLRKTVYTGSKSEEVIDYVLSAYDETGLPGEVTIYDRSKDGGDNLDETRTYNIDNLNVNFNAGSWKTLMTYDRLKSRSVYAGEKDEEKIQYTLGTYMFNDPADSETNEANTFTIYDYEGTSLKETRTFDVSEMNEDDYIMWKEDPSLENMGSISNRTTYTGEDGKEKMVYTLSYFLDSENTIQAWERKEYVYVDDQLKETLTYDISEDSLTAEAKVELGIGYLQEHAFYVGDKGFERMDYAYSLFDRNNVNHLLETKYVYDGKSMRNVETYDISDTYNGGVIYLQESTEYLGRPGSEYVASFTSFYSSGKIMKMTDYLYEENSRGVEYAAMTVDETFSQNGDLLEKIETVSDILFEVDGIKKEDLNGNIRNMNIKTYYTMNGFERIDREETVKLSNYAGPGKAANEVREIYDFDEAGLRQAVPVERQEIVNQKFNHKNSPMVKDVLVYSRDENGILVKDVLKKIVNYNFDYYGNVGKSTETVEKYENEFTKSLLYYKVISNEYDDLMGRRRGSSTNTEMTRYLSLEANEFNKIDRTVTTSTNLDNGYAIDQVLNMYVTDRLADPVNPVEKLVEQKITKNFDINAKGNAREQHITTYKTGNDGNFILDENGQRIESSYLEITNREFDAYNNVMNQLVVSYYDSSQNEPYEVKEIRSYGYHPSGTASMQIIASYGDIDKNELIDVLTVENKSISHFGDVLLTVNTRYNEASIQDNKEGAIIYSGPIERETITNKSLDIRGNIMLSEKILEYYDTEINAFAFNRAQRTSYSEYNYQNRVSTITVDDYSDPLMKDWKARQITNYEAYDDFGNVLEQRSNLYRINDSGIPVHVELKTISMKYDHLIAIRRGNPTYSETIRYDTEQPSNDGRVERIVNESILATDFDNKGNVLHQITSSYRYSPGHVEAVADGWVKISGSETFNTNYTFSGYPQEKEIQSWQYKDVNGTWSELFIDKREIFTLKYDSKGNAVHQVTLTYDENEQEPSDIKEVLSSSFDYSGVAINQTTATYGAMETDPHAGMPAPLMSSIMDIIKTNNLGITILGDITHSISTTYYVIAEDGTMPDNLNNIDLSKMEKTDQQEVMVHEYTSGEYAFDRYGNVLDQTIIKSYYDITSIYADNEGFVLGEEQIILNQEDTIDMYGNVHDSRIITYAYDEEELASGAKEWVKDSGTLQKMKYLDYDQYGNILESTNSTYSDINTPDEEDLISHKHTQNTYSNKRLLQATTTTYSSIFETDGTEIQKTVTDNHSFDDRDNVLSQSTTSSTYNLTHEGADGSGWVVTNRSDISYDFYDNRGDAAYQEITSYQYKYDTSTDAPVTVTPVFVDTKIMSNRRYDSRHNIVNQLVAIYKDGMTVPSEVQEIRSSAYTSSGVARIQLIATYSELDASTLDGNNISADTRPNFDTFIDLRKVENLNIDVAGNVINSMSTTYIGSISIESGSYGKIIYSEAEQTDRQITLVLKDETGKYAFDLRGNVLKQLVIKSYFSGQDVNADQDGFVISEEQIITNDESTIDIYGYVHDSEIITFAYSVNKDTSNFEKDNGTYQKIEYIDYDHYGNVLEQKISTYDDIVTPEAEDLISHKHTWNTYDGRNMLTSTTIKYNDISEELGTEIDKTVMTNNSFDNRGNVEEQETVKSVYKPQELGANADGWVETSMTVTSYYEYDNRGDAGIQETITHQYRYEANENDNTQVTTQEIFVDKKIMTNRLYDSRHNVVNQLVMTYRDDAATIPSTVQEIRNIGYSFSGVPRIQITATFDALDASGIMADINTLLDVVVVNNEMIDTSGNILKSSSVTYTGNIEVDPNGDINYSMAEKTDLQTMEVLKDISGQYAFDQYGNTLKQKIIKSYYDPSSEYADNGFVLGEEQIISNFEGQIDIYGNTLYSEIITYGYDPNLDGTDLIRDDGTLQKIQYLDYDVYGNVLEQKASIYNDIGNPDADNLISHKHMRNTYDVRNMTTSETITYSDISEEPETEIGKTYMVNQDFDLRGNVITQETVRSIYDPTKNGADAEGWVNVTRSRINNYEYNNRGDAGSQSVDTYQYVYEEDSQSNVYVEEKFVSRKEMGNRTYDSRHNILNQIVVTYKGDDQSDLGIADVQEIRSKGYTGAGVAKQQLIITYEGIDETTLNTIGRVDSNTRADAATLIDLKEVINEKVDVRGNIIRSITTTYAGDGVVIQEGGYGEIVYSNAEKMDRQVVEVLAVNGEYAFDKYGNILKQSVLKSYYDPASIYAVDGFVTADEQIISNSEDRIDIYGNMGYSEIITYAYISSSDGQNLIRDNGMLQKIERIDYDVYGNSLEQKISTYSDITTPEAEDLVSHKHTWNSFDGRNMTSSETISYEDVTESDSSQIDRVITLNTDFDGTNILAQETTKAVYTDKGSWADVNRTVIKYDNYTNRGDAEYQKTESYKIMGTNEIYVETKIITNRKYDSSHNVINQLLTTFRGTSTIPVDIQEIRSRGYTSSGIAKNQVIATFGALTNTGVADLDTLVDVKVVNNDHIDVVGNVIKSETVTYIGNISINDNGIGDIDYSQAEKSDRQVVEVINDPVTGKYAIDKYGNILWQNIIKSYYDETSEYADNDGFVMGEEQNIISGTYDIYGNVGESEVKTFAYIENESGTALIKDSGTLQLNTYSEYNKYGNVLKQSISTYDGLISIPDNLISHKTIVNTYDHETSKNLVRSETTTYSSTDEIQANYVEMTLTLNNDFDPRGNVLAQSTTKLVYEDNDWARVNITNTTYADYDNRGDAKTQTTVSYKVAGASTAYVETRVMTNRNFDSRHNVVNQLSSTYRGTEAIPGDPVDVQEIRSRGYTSSGVARQQVIATFGALTLEGEADIDTLVDVKVVNNDLIDVAGNVIKSETVTYIGNIIIEDNGTGAIDYSRAEKSDRQTVEVLKDPPVTGKYAIDKYGNILKQTIIKSYYDETSIYKDAEGFVIGEEQVIASSGHDIYGNVGRSEIITYAYNENDAGTELVPDTGTLEINKYLEYDQYNNVVEQSVSTYDGILEDESNLISHKTTLNTYDITGKKLLETETITYSGTIEIAENFVDKTHTTNTLFDTRGNVLAQNTDSYAYAINHLAADNDGWVQLNHTETIYSDYDNRGDAGSQITETSQFRENERGEWTELFQDKRVTTNRVYDSRHNVVNQLVATYAIENSDVPTEVQEIRSSGYTSSGVARMQLIAVYGSLNADGEAADEMTFVDFKIVNNQIISVTGNIIKSVTTTYEGKVEIIKTLDGQGYTVYGNIDHSQAKVVDRETVQVTKFDISGNPLEKNVLKEYYEPNNEYAGTDGFAAGESQIIINIYDDLGRDISESDVITYAYDQGATDTGTFQHTVYDSYDTKGNVLISSVSTYDGITAIEANLISHKSTTNVYDEKGKNLTESTTITYKSTIEDPAYFVEKSIARNNAFDTRGNVLTQTSETYGYDGTDWIILNHTATTNGDYDSRGDAGSQVTETWQYRKNATGEWEELFQDKRIITNRTYDSRHNILNQLVATYTIEGSDIPTEVQEIRSYGYTSAGVARTQLIAVYRALNATGDAADENTFVDFKIVNNEKISVTGNIIKSVTTTYLGDIEILKIADSEGNIICGDFDYSRAESVDRETIEVAVFDIKGNPLEQTVLKEYYEPNNEYAETDGFAKGDLQEIKNTFDLLGRDISVSDVITYAYVENATKTDLVKDAGTFQHTVYDSYDAHGNVLESSVSTYEGTTALETNMINHKVITNVYDGSGKNLLESTAITYKSTIEDRSNFVEKSIVRNNTFDIRGNVLTQTTETYAFDRTEATPAWVMTDRIETVNGSYDARGDAGNQTSETWQYRKNDSGEWAELFQDKRVITNRTYDSRHNILNQLVATYTIEGSDIPTEVQEIRSYGYTSAGVARAQLIAVYEALDAGGYSADENTFLDFKIVNNEIISVTGNIIKSVTTSYAGDIEILKTQDREGNIIYGDFDYTKAEAVDRETILVSVFDITGNPLEQKVLKEYYEPNNEYAASDGFAIGEEQEITNTFDVFGRDILESDAITYAYENGSRDTGTLQHTVYKRYDSQGNALSTSVTTYDGTEEISERLISHKSTINIFDAPGKNLTESTTITYKSTEEIEANFIEKTITQNNTFDARGNVLTQTTQSYVYDMTLSSPYWTITYKTETINSDYTARGDAGTQLIKTWKGNDFVSSTHAYNRSYDSRHNVTSQFLVEYADIDMKTPEVSVQEILSRGYTSAGTARGQKIYTYGSVDAARNYGDISTFVDYKDVNNSLIDVKGTALISETTTYADINGQMPVSRQITEVVKDTNGVYRIDKYGNILEQTSERFVVVDGMEKFATKQRIFNDIYDIYGNVTSATVDTYLDTDMAVFAERNKTINNSHDKYGNVISQDITRFEDIDEQVVIDHKEITNSYGDLAAKGLTSSSIIKSYTSIDKSTLFSKITVRYADYDRYGNAASLETNRYNNNDMLLDVKKTVSVYASPFDAICGNATYSSTSTYNNAGNFVERQAQELSGYDVYGNALSVILTRYASVDNTLLLDKKNTAYTYDQGSLDHYRGNTNSTTIASYDEDNRLITRQEINSTLYDEHSNALNQTITSWHIDEYNGNEVRLETQTITNTYDGIDLYRGNVSTSDILTKYDVGGYSERQFVDYRNIDLSSSYDDYGNASRIKTDRYRIDDPIATTFTLLDSSVIANDYDYAGNMKDVILGNARSTVMESYDDQGELIETRNIAYYENNNSSYDNYGNALYQNVETITGTAVKEQEIISVFKDVSRHRKQAEETNVISMGVNQHIMNESYDEYGNSTIQVIEKYTGEGENKIVLEIIKIENVYSGVGLAIGNPDRSILTTLDGESNFVDKKIIDYSGYDDYGNAAVQNIYLFDNVNASMGDIYAERTEIKSTFTGMNQHKSLADDSYITTYYGGNDSDQFARRQYIKYNRYDDFGNALTQTIYEYDNLNANFGHDYLNKKNITNVYEGTNAITGFSSSAEIKTMTMQGDLAEWTLIDYADNRYDALGNSLEQVVYTYDTNDTDLTNGIDILKETHILNTYDGRGKVTGNTSTSDMITYFGASDQEDVLFDHQFIEYRDYDVHGNATSQSISTYKVLPGDENETIVAVKNVFNTYEGIGSVKGNVKTSTIDSFRSGAQIDRVMINNSSYDSYGNALYQSILTSRKDAEGLFQKADERIIESSYADDMSKIKGLVSEQDIFTYVTGDYHEFVLENNERVVSSHKHISNNIFDNYGNATDQTIISYLDKTDAYAYEKQNIISSYDPDGKLKEQEMLTSSLSKDGNDIVFGDVTDTRIVTYSDYDEFDNAQKVVVMQYDGTELLKTTTTDINEFDIYGNSLVSTITEVSNIDNMTTKRIINNNTFDGRSNYDLHNRVIASIVENYAFDANNNEILTDKQIIKYESYDIFNNVITQSIDTYDCGNDLLNHKKTTYTYSGNFDLAIGSDDDMNLTLLYNSNSLDVNAVGRMGQAITTTTTTWSSENNIIGKTIAVSEAVDSSGNILDQIVDTYYRNEDTYTSRKSIQNRGIDASGNSLRQYILTKTSNEESVSYQEIINTRYTSDHIAKQQSIRTYLDETKGVLLDVQETEVLTFDIYRNTTEQTISTYAVHNQCAASRNCCF
ncbi:MAG: hypothetical protein HQL29_02260 [Candidatus Omnitrophica bacterium]|nr:hypothetical protein [Candidatus Omnitrophota bacterium]